MDRCSASVVGLVLRDFLEEGSIAIMGDCGGCGGREGGTSVEG